MDVAFGYWEVTIVELKDEREILGERGQCCIEVELRMGGRKGNGIRMYALWIRTVEEGRRMKESEAVEVYSLRYKGASRGRINRTEGGASISCTGLIQ